MEYMDVINSTNIMIGIVTIVVLYIIYVFFFKKNDATFDKLTVNSDETVDTITVNNLSVLKDASFKGDLHVDGKLTVNGQLTVGEGISTRHALNTGSINTGSLTSTGDITGNTITSPTAHIGQFDIRGNRIGIPGGLDMNVVSTWLKLVNYGTDHPATTFFDPNKYPEHANQPYAGTGGLITSSLSILADQIYPYSYKSPEQNSVISTPSNPLTEIQPT